jgi:hypothetical protein
MFAAVVPKLIHSNGVTVGNNIPIIAISINPWYLIGRELKYFVTALFLRPRILNQKE